MTLRERIYAEISTLTPRNEFVGTVQRVAGPVVEIRLPHCSIGELCTIETVDNRKLQGRVIGFEGELTRIAPFDRCEGVSPGGIVRSAGEEVSVPCGMGLLGRVIDPLGAPRDGREAVAGVKLPLFQSPPNPLSRENITRPFITGITSVDTLFPIGHGQRMALIAPAGAGKSTLLGQIAKSAECDVVVVGLVGERGREVRPFIEENLGAEGRRRSVVVVATSDEPPMKRALAPMTATVIASYFRSQGLNVLLLIDSLTRTARALREVGFANGEIPVRGGYTPSVYSELPRLLEMAGTDGKGSITAVYTLLHQSDGADDPLAEEVKSLVDGHLVLTPRLSALGLRPSIDPTLSISRLASELLDAGAIERQREILRIFQRLRSDKDLVLLGGQPDGELQAFLSLEKELYQTFSQDTAGFRGVDESHDRVSEFLNRLFRVYAPTTVC